MEKRLLNNAGGSDYTERDDFLGLWATVSFFQFYDFENFETIKYYYASSNHVTSPTLFLTSKYKLQSAFKIFYFIIF